MTTGQVKEFFCDKENVPCPLTEKLVKAGYQQISGGYIDRARWRNVKVSYKENSPSQYWHLMTYCDSRRSDHPFTKSITCGELVCLSFIGCDNLECLYIPYTCPEESFDAILGGTDTVGAICFWDKPYVPEELDPNESWSDDQVYIDDKDVVYTVDRKRLLYARCGFTDNEYAIPEGTLTICDHAFLFHEDYLVLYVPASIKVIGDDIFGKEGGKIVFRDRYS